MATSSPSSDSTDVTVLSSQPRENLSKVQQSTLHRAEQEQSHSKVIWVYWHKVQGFLTEGFIKKLQNAKLI